MGVDMDGWMVGWLVGWLVVRCVSVCVVGPFNNKINQIRQQQQTDEFSPSSSSAFFSSAIAVLYCTAEHCTVYSRNQVVL